MPAPDVAVQGMKVAVDVGDGGSSTSLTGAVKTLSSDTARVSYDVVCRSGG